MWMQNGLKPETAALHWQDSSKLLFSKVSSTVKHGTAAWQTFLPLFLGVGKVETLHRIRPAARQLRRLHTGPHGGLLRPPSHLAIPGTWAQS